MRIHVCGVAIAVACALISTADCGNSKSGGSAIPASSSTGEPRTPQVNQPSSPESNGQWKTNATTDEMTGQSNLQADMIADADSNGRHGNFQVTATCTANMLAFTITYKSAFDRDLGFRQTQGASMVTMYNGAGTMDTPKPQVNLRVRIDEGNVIGLVSTSNYRNQATVVFTQRDLRDTLSSESSRGAQSPTSGQDIQGLLGRLQEMATAFGAAGATADAYHAKIIRVQLPLDNGDAPILVIRPQDSSFRAFASKCAAVDPSAFENAVNAADGFIFGSETVLPSRLFRVSRSVRNGIPRLSPAGSANDWFWRRKISKGCCLHLPGRPDMLADRP